MIDIREMPNIIEAVNAILNNKSIAEIKKEGKNGVVVVEIKRTLKTAKPKEEN